MRIEFKKLTIENFMAYERAELDFTRFGHSLVMVTGDNKLSAPWSSNGSGKTTLAEALYWCLYGTTMRKMPIGGVINRFSEDKTCAVTLELSNDGALYTVVRTRNPNELKVGIGGKWCAGDAAAKLLNQVFPLSSKLFTAFIYFGGSDRGSGFHRLNDTDRKDAISELYPQLRELSKLHSLASGKLATAKYHASALDAATTSILQQKEALMDNIMVKRKELALVVKRDAEVRSTLTDRIAALTKQIAAGEEVNAANQARYAKLGVEVSEQEKKFMTDFDAKHGCDEIELDIKLDQARKDVSSTKLRLISIETDQRRVQSQTACPTCRRPFDDTTQREQALAGLNKERLKLLTCLPHYEEQYAHWLGLRSELKAGLEQIRRDSDLVKVGQAYLISNQELNAAKETLSAVQRRHDNLNVQSGQLKATIAGLEDMLLKLDGDLKQQDGLRESCHAELQVLEVLKAVLSQTGLPAMFMDGLLTNVEYYANIMSASLTDGNLTISISVDKSNESYSREGAINITAVNSTGANLYGGNSSGERARVDLCILFGLVRAIANTTGLEVSLLFLDEVLDSIDEAGVIAVVETLAKEILPYRQNILLTTHNTPLYNHVSNMGNVKMLRVTKTDNVARVE